MFRLITLLWLASVTVEKVVVLGNPKNQPSSPSKGKCVLPPYPAHGSYVETDDPTAKPGQVLRGAVLDFSCDPGYELSDSKETICFNGVWSGEIPTCQLSSAVIDDLMMGDQPESNISSAKSSCVLPSYPTNGSFVVYTYNVIQAQLNADPKVAVIPVNCDSGYQLMGSKYTVCYKGVWSGDLPKCVLTSELCVLPPLPAHGSYTVLKNPAAVPGQAFESVVLDITCKPGYKMFEKATSIVICSKGKWSDKITDCTLDLCVLPPFPAHGSYIVAGLPSAAPGQSIPSVALNITCDPGYDIPGETERTCNNGVWSKNVPDCIAKEELCILPPFPSNGKYTLVGKQKQTVVPGQAFDTVVLRITCDPEYKIPDNQDSLVKCTSGRWSEKITDCEPTITTCVLPKHPAHGSYIVVGIPDAVPGQSFNSVALNITCDPGFNTEGDKEIICYSGMWSGDITDCKATQGTCVLPPFPPNGKYFVAGKPNAAPGQAFDSVALIITCDYGYDISGRKDRTCHKGTWSEEVNNCVPTSRLCVLPPFPAYGSYKVFDKPNAKPGQAFDSLSLEVICDPGYKYPHFEHILCLDGSWITTNVDCVSSKQLCIQTPYDDGSYKITIPNATDAKPHFIMSFTYICEVGFGRPDLEHICFDTSTHDTVAGCVAVAPASAIPASPGTESSTVRPALTLRAPETPLANALSSISEELNLNTSIRHGGKSSGFCRLEKNPTVNYRCLVSAGSWDTRECNLDEPSGTIVWPECSAFHYSTVTLNTMTCGDGSWDYIARCKPDCGIVTIIGPNSDENLLGGLAAKAGEVPWHAGIYRKESEQMRQICGGSIVSPTVVISAGHCFLSGASRIQPASYYGVAVGKLYRDWSDIRDESQLLDVSKVVVPKRFQGSVANYQEDLALVFLQQAIIYKKHVRPVCLDFGVELEDKQLQRGNLGKVAGWGLTSEDGTPALNLQVGEMPYVPIEACIAEAPIHFRGYITSDKICAGYRAGKAVCKGDSGGGLVFPADRDGIRYHLRGVVSTAPNNGTRCNANWYTTYTQLSRHERFINKFIRK